MRVCYLYFVWLSVPPQVVYGMARLVQRKPRAVPMLEGHPCHFCADARSWNYPSYVLTYVN